MIKDLIYPTKKEYASVGMTNTVPLEPGYVVPACNDKVFKNIANDIHTRRFFAKIINLTTSIDYEYLVKNIRLVSNNTQEGSVFEHFNEQDVIVTFDNTTINVEMAIDNKNRNILKNQTTSFKLAGNVYKVSEDYKKTYYFYQICIENYDFVHNDLLITEVNLVDVSSGNYEITNKTYKEFHVNLKNIPDLCYNELDEKEKYFKFFTLNKIEDLEELSKGDEILKEAVDKVISLSSDSSFISELEHEQIEEYARRVAQQMDKEEAEEEGKKKEKIEIAKNMLNDKVSIDIISKYTGLSVDQINSIDF